MNERERVIRALEQVYEAAPAEVFREAVRLLKEAAGPERTGRWVWDRKDRWKCSECGTVYGAEKAFVRYCTMCGAKMG